MNNEVLEYISNFAKDFPKPFFAFLAFLLIPLTIFLLHIFLNKAIQKIVEKAFIEQINKM